MSKVITDKLNLPFELEFNLILIQPVAQVLCEKREKILVRLCRSALLFNKLNNTFLLGHWEALYIKYITLVAQD